MAHEWKRDRLVADGFGRVHVELDWYDGPRQGLADVDGHVHYFELCDAENTYLVWQPSEDVVAQELEQ